MAISIDFLANVRDVLRGGEQVEATFEAVADSLDDLAQDGRTAGDKVASALDTAADAADDLGKAGDKAGDRLADGIDDGARDARSSVDRLEASFKDMADNVRRDTSTAGDAIDQNIGRGTRGAKRSIDEFKDESVSTAKESAASFDGSADSIVDAFQEVAANAFAGFGGAGLVAGLGIAAGIGIGSKAIQDVIAGDELMKERVRELGQEYIDTGKISGVSLDFLVDKLKELATNTEDGTVKLADLQDQAGVTGSDFRKLAQAYAGSTDELDDLVRTEKAHLDQLRAEADAIDTTSSTAYGNALRRADAQQMIVDQLEKTQSAANDAAASEAAYLAAGGAAMETRAAAVDTYQSAIDESVGSFDNFKNAETNALDPAGYLASIQARIDATANFNTNVADLATRFGLTDAEIQAVLDQGIDFAPMLQSIKDSGLEGEFVAKLQAAVGGGQAVLDGTDLSATAEVDANTDKATNAAEIFTSTKRETTITAKADTATAESQIRAAAAGDYRATVRVDADLSDADAAVDAWLRRRRTITVTANVVDRNGSPVE